MAVKIDIFPNPCTDYINVKWESSPGDILVTLFDSIGSRLKVFSSNFTNDGTNTIKIETNHLLPGNYALHIRASEGQISRLFTKV